MAPLEELSPQEERSGTDQAGTRVRLPAGAPCPGVGSPLARHHQECDPARRAPSRGDVVHHRGVIRLRVPPPDPLDTSSTTGPVSAGEVAGEGFLLVRLDRTFAVPGADPTDCFAGRLPAEDGETGERGAGATVAAVTADLHA